MVIGLIDTSEVQGHVCYMAYLFTHSANVYRYLLWPDTEPHAQMDTVEALPPNAPSRKKSLSWNSRLSVLPHLEKQ